MAEKPLQQQFSDEIREVLDKFKDSGLTNGEAIGVLDMHKFNLNFTIAMDEYRRKKPF